MKSVRTLGGNPVLVPAAEDAVKQWKFEVCQAGNHFARRDQFRSGEVKADRDAEPRGRPMTISRKLYVGFGSIVAILVLLFITNTTVVLRERAASRQASVALESVQSLEAVQLKIMQIRLRLQDYLLTGDQREPTR